MAGNYTKILLDDYHKLELENSNLDKENKYLKYEYKLLENKYKTLESKYNSIDVEELNRIKLEKEKEVLELQNQIDKLQKENTRLKSLLNTDGTNAGIPTSKTPINKKKVIPNSRKKSNKKIGGQENHKKHKLERFNDNEINEEAYIELKTCPSCNNKKLIDTNETIDKDVFDYKLVLIKRRVKFKTYKCSCCGKIVHAQIPNDLKEENQYGPNVKALILSLLNEGYVSINRVRRIVKGFTKGEIDLSEGYIAKVQKNAAKDLINFNDELKLKLLKERILYWDDTVIFVNKRKSCLRFYGNEQFALYKAHEQKNKEGLDKDNILNSLDKSKFVMHDHNIVNYNEDYSFINIECNAHLQRDLQKVVDNLGHIWAKRLKELISKSIEKRKELIEKGLTSDEEFSKEFFNEFEEIMLSSFEENKNDNNKYYTEEERTLIVRILDYKENYFAWVTDFELPTTNNLSERGLRGTKSKLKISGQFQNISRASDYALIKSYIQTSYINKINPYDALLRLCLGKPYTIKEIIGEKNS